jgi:hypothetical protein
MAFTCAWFARGSFPKRCWPNARKISALRFVELIFDGSTGALPRPGGIGDGARHDSSDVYVAAVMDLRAMATLFPNAVAILFYASIIPKVQEAAEAKFGASWPELVRDYEALEREHPLAHDPALQLRVSLKSLQEAAKQASGTGGPWPIASPAIASLPY